MAFASTAAVEELLTSGARAHVVGSHCATNRSAATHRVLAERVRISDGEGLWTRRVHTHVTCDHAHTHPRMTPAPSPSLAAAAASQVPDGVRFRPAAADDLPAVVEAYNAGIRERVATFETEPRTVADLARWPDDGQPFIVAESNGRVLGWARAGRYSDRCVYDGVGEHAVYVSPDARGRGLGRGLLVALCELAEHRGLYKLTSRVFSDNHASLAAHRAAGFEEVGVQRRHGRLEGEWKDCVLVERLLGPAAQ